MSKTLNYSLLLLRSSKRMQEKVLKGLDAKSRTLLEDKLSTVPLFEVAKLRVLKAQLVSSNEALLDTVEDNKVESEVSCKASERAINFIVSSSVFHIESKDEASAYYQNLSGKSQQFIGHYLESKEVINER
ncbi:hypothetical protein [Enterovibrio norvegicus]|uniref:Uncharacterized protein n=1 Tax=Enterovibrio norvegicus TaxID=188144 RepID=A0ABV4L4C2_9GAMM|nr:hypothetical protein [Enterovibrio norvegicus]OEF55554.1 hypothetical protein A1OU_24675 [Enterovibrio norvegicus]